MGAGAGDDSLRAGPAGTAAASQRSEATSRRTTMKKPLPRSDSRNARCSATARWARSSCSPGSSRATAARSGTSRIPTSVLAIQRRYAEAGSDCILTNTFGGIRIMLNRHGNAGQRRRDQQGRGGDRRARRSAAATGYVIGDIGPFGGLMEPYGEFTEAAGARGVHRAGARRSSTPAPTRSSSRRRPSWKNCGIGIAAAKEAGAPCVIGSMAYDVTLDGSTFRTMMGIDPERAAEFMQENGADIVALNCGTGHGHGARAARRCERYKAATDLPVMAQPNAGQPKLIEHEGRLRRDARADGATASCRCSRRARTSSARCCGSTPDHIRAFREAMDEYLKRTTHEDTNSATSTPPPRKSCRRRRRTSPASACTTSTRTSSR